MYHLSVNFQGTYLAIRWTISVFTGVYVAGRYLYLYPIISSDIVWMILWIDSAVFFFFQNKILVKPNDFQLPISLPHNYFLKLFFFNFNFHIRAEAESRKFCSFWGKSGKFIRSTSAALLIPLSTWRKQNFFISQKWALLNNPFRV